MSGELSRLTQLRFLLGAVGGLALPFWLSVFVEPHAARLDLDAAALSIAAVSALCLVAGEFVERSLFFMAAASPKMPGAVGQ
jgi:formate dehydrogenase iron-sulfur subunit